MNGFRRGQEPKDALGLGSTGEVKKWLEGNNTARATHYTKLEDSIVIAEVEGNVVLENFDIGNPDFMRKWGLKEIKFGKVTGSITILNTLTIQEIYSKIKNFYEKVLDECLGKTLEKQEEYIFGKYEMPLTQLHIKLKAGVIENSEEYIRNLPDKPTIEEMNDLVEQVLSGNLEYGCPAKDDYCVKMKQYAEVMKKINFEK